MRFVAVSLALFCCACPKPDSVELGAECTDTVECKDPGDTCVHAVGKKRCTMPCNAENVCPESFVCARMDISVREPGGETWTGERGYCLPSAEVPPRAAKIRPKKKRKRRRKRRGKQ